MARTALHLHCTRVGGAGGVEERRGREAPFVLALAPRLSLLFFSFCLLFFFKQKTAYEIHR